MQVTFSANRKLPTTRTAKPPMAVIARRLRCRRLRCWGFRTTDFDLREDTQACNGEEDTGPAATGCARSPSGSNLPSGLLTWQARADASCGQQARRRTGTRFPYAAFAEGEVGGRPGERNLWHLFSGGIAITCSAHQATQDDDCPMGFVGENLSCGYLSLPVPAHFPLGDFEDSPYRV